MLRSILLMQKELSKDVLRYHVENLRQVFCNTSLLKSWVTAPDESTLQTLSQVFCQSAALEIISVINSTLLINQVICTICSM